MKDFSKRFYNSKAWQSTRNAYFSARGGLCENCLANGKITAGEIVHHKVPLTIQNINNAEITLGWGNLEVLCRECHAERHGARATRYKINPDGSVVLK